MLARAHSREMHATNGNIECRYTGDDGAAFEAARTAMAVWKPAAYVERANDEERLVIAEKKVTGQTLQRRTEDRGKVVDVRPTRHVCVRRSQARVGTEQEGTTAAQPKPAVDPGSRGAGEVQLGNWRN